MATPAKIVRPLTIALGTKLRSGPFGGGNQFGHTLAKYLTQQGHTVVDTLTTPHIDVIILTEPRPWSASGAFDVTQAIRYRQQHPTCQIIHRINECDERKGRTLKLHNRLLWATAHQADAVVFVSQWLKQLHLIDAPRIAAKSQVILSGADATTFNSHGRTQWAADQPLRIVTHHWASNWHKGWDVYQQLDILLSGPLQDQVEFTFIGNPWPKAKLTNTSLIAPVSGSTLAAALKDHHVYISASLNEPAGMHFIEGLSCGLPILYRSSGSLPEYCAPYGVSFGNAANLQPALYKLIKNYQTYFQKLSSYSYSAADMCQQYELLCQQLAERNQPHVRRTTAIPLLRLHQSALFIRDSLT